jgi:hypothetical protein
MDAYYITRVIAFIDEVNWTSALPSCSIDIIVSNTIVEMKSVRLIALFRVVLIVSRITTYSDSDLFRLFINICLQSWETFVDRASKLDKGIVQRCDFPFHFLLLLNLGLNLYKFFLFLVFLCIQLLDILNYFLYSILFVLLFYF